MALEIQQVLHRDVEALRDLYRARASCQLVHDSAIRRGLADAYLLLRSGEAVGYGAVWQQYYPGRVVEFFVVEEMRSLVEELFPRFIEMTDATHIEAQTNVPDMLRLLRRWGVNTVEEKTLFADQVRTRLTCSAAIFRRCSPDGEWLLELNGEVVARGGALSHYNPPYRDLYMEVSESHRRRGFGSYMVQELKRICYEDGKVPGARCDPDNLGSRRTLEKAGMRVCGSLLAAELRAPGKRRLRSRRGG